MALPTLIVRAAHVAAWTAHAPWTVALAGKGKGKGSRKGKAAAKALAAMAGGNGHLAGVHCTWK